MSGSDPSGLSLFVLDGTPTGTVLGYCPPQIRRAIELLTIYLDGLATGRATTGKGDMSATARQITEVARAASGSGSLTLSACGGVSGDLVGIVTPADRDVVVVWGPGAAGLVKQALNLP